MPERADSNAWRGYASLAFAILVIAIFIQRFVLVPLLVLRLGAATVAALLEAAAIIGTGGAARLLFARLSSSAPRHESIAVDFLAGYPLFGTLAFLSGLIRVSTATMTIPITFGLACLVIRRTVAGTLPDARRPATFSPPAAPLVTWPAAAVIVTVLGCGLLEVQTPPSTLDELAYHLTIPKSWATEGRVVDLPLLSHSYFPLGIESADLPLFSLLPGDAGYASHLLHFFAAVAALLVGWRFLARRASGSVALTCTAAIVSVPALAVTSGWSLVDWPLAGLCVLVAESLADEEPDLASFGVVLAAGLLTKYTFWPIAAIAIVAMLAAGRLDGRLIRSAGCALALGMVFPLRNLILTGNPLAPFLSAHSPHVAGYRDTGSINGTFVSYIFDGRFTDEALGIGLVTLTFVFVLLGGWRERRPRNLFAGGTLLLAVLLSLTTPSARILVPSLCVPALFGAIALERLRSGARRSMLAALLVAALLQTSAVVYFMSTTDPFTLLSGRMSEEQYLAKARPSYAAVRWVDGQLPEQSRTLIIGLHELYEFEHNVRGGGNFDGPRMSAYLSGGTAEDVARRLRADGFTHVALFESSLVPQTASAAKSEERSTRLSPEAAASVLGLLERGATPVARSQFASLYKLR
jgi:hypothetical protein